VKGKEATSRKVGNLETWFGCKMALGHLQMEGALGFERGEI